MSSRGGGGGGRRGGPRPHSPPGPIFPSHLIPKGPSNPSQTMVDIFWSRFTTRNPGKATTLLPKNELAERLSKRRAAKDLAGGGSKTTATSYEEAAAACRSKVAQIVLECRRVNQKYRDPHFDLDYDLKSGQRNCLVGVGNYIDDYEQLDSRYSSGTDSGGEGSARAKRKRHHKHATREGERSRSAYLLYGERNVDGRGKRSAKEKRRVPGGYESDADDDDDDSHVSDRVGHDKLRSFPGSSFNPRSVKRVGEIFDNPEFYVEGPTANDIRQGADGDCWFMAALCTLTNKPGLVKKVCVARDEKVGVYGFVFHRDGEWFSEIIDDKLYLKKPDYDEKNSAVRQRNVDRVLWDEMEHRQDPDEHYRKTFQANSTALYFAQCEHPNETWLPLLEKAYAKAHGDYASIDGGFTGEGIEDLTGGVTSELFTADILDTEHFWKDGLMKVNDEFLFGCSTGDWRGYGERKGIQERHAYSVLRAVEIDGKRLVLLKNPWGKGEWQGAWSDGSKEWTAEWMKKLDHSFGDDGAFWISYEDLLRKYQHFDRTRLFDDKWKVTSMWTTLNVSWAPDYNDTKFSFTLEKSGPVVLVLSQLDDRYFRGFEGAYTFGIGFRLHKAGEKEYLVRTQTTYRMTRSCNVELNLEAGEYTVLVKIDATRWSDKMAPADVIRYNAKYRREKLLRIAMAYDLAHSKAQIAETPEEKEARERHVKRQKAKYREKIRKAVMDSSHKQYQQQCQDVKMQRKQRAHNFAWQKKQFEKREAKLRAAEEARQQEWEREHTERRSVGGNRGGSVKGETPVEEGQPEAEVKVEAADGKPDETDRVPEPEASTDAGENTPSASTNSGSAAEAEKCSKEGDSAGVAVEKNSTEDTPPERESSEEELKAIQERLDVVEDGLNRLIKKADEMLKTSEEGTQEDTLKAEGNDPEKASEQEVISSSQATEQPAAPENEAEQALQTFTQDAAAPTPLPTPRDEDPRISQLQHRVRRALNVVTHVERELHSILVDAQADGGPASDREEEGKSPHPHARHAQQQLPGPRQHLSAHSHQLADHQNLRPPSSRHHPHSREPSPHPHGHAQQNRPPAPASSYMDEAPAPPRQRQFIPPGQRFRQPPPQDFDSEPESIMPPCSPLEMSDAELDCIVEDNERDAMRLFHTERQFVRPPPPPPPPGPGLGLGPIGPRGRSPPPPPRGRGLAFGDGDEPWNAVAVVGLRVYYKVDEEGGDTEGKEGVKLKVVRPIYYDDSESEDEKEGEGDGKVKEEMEEEKQVEETKILDVDDSAKDAIEEVEGCAKE
ncbi:putative calpain-1 catalytic subunit [Cladorrhinum sp. PSN332]|nr:putative calpain-1 catalytic subunit [Cladorrhinum sp. PSN332]